MIKIKTSKIDYIKHLREKQYIVQSPSCVRLFKTPWTAAGFPVPPVYQNLPKFMSTASVVPSNHLILCHPLLLLLSIFPSIRVFSDELAVCIRWQKSWSFSSNNNKYEIIWILHKLFQETLHNLLYKVRLILQSKPNTL